MTPGVRCATCARGLSADCLPLPSSANATASRGARPAGTAARAESLATGVAGIAHREMDELLRLTNHHGVPALAIEEWPGRYIGSYQPGRSAA
jgi:hypothetical protein